MRIVIGLVIVGLLSACAMSREQQASVDAALGVGGIALGIVGIAGGNLGGIADVVSGATWLGMSASEATGPTPTPTAPEPSSR